MAPTVSAVYTSVQGDGGNVGLGFTTDTAPSAGDYIIVGICINANGDTIGTPATGTWSQISVPDNSIATAGGQIRAYRLDNPADSTTYTFTVSSSTRRSIIALLISGGHATPATFINAASSLQSAPGANHTPPTLSSTVNDCLIVDFAGLRQFSPDVANWTVPAAGLTWTERADVQGADSNNNIRLAAGTAVQASSGAIPTNVWTNSDVFEDSIIIRIALAPAAGGSTQNLTGTGITSGEAFGTGTVTSVRNLTGTGIASGEAFGSGTVTSVRNLTGTGIASGEAFGTGQVTSVRNLTGTGIASAEAFGTGAVTSVRNLTGTGIASAEAFGSGIVTPGAVTVTGAGIASGEAFGSGSVTPGAVTVTGSGIASAEALGVGSVTTGPVSVTGTGIGSAEAFGSGAVSAGGTILIGAGISSGEAFGSGSVSPGPVSLAGAGIGSAEAFGSGVVSSGVVVSGSGIGSAETFGAGSVSQTGPPAQTLTGVGIGSAEAFGVGFVGDAQAQQITGEWTSGGSQGGIGSAEAFGHGTITRLGAPVCDCGADLGFLTVFGRGRVTVG